jgi:hypothetical protein
MSINKVRRLTSASSISAPKVIKVTRAPKILKTTRPEVEKFVSKPLNSRGRKKVQREMDEVLKKLDATKNPKVNNAHKSRKDRYFDGEKTNSVFALSGGLPGLGKRR